MKSKKFLKLMALALCVAVMLPMVFACGKKDEDNVAATEGGAAPETQAPATDPPPTDPPPPTEPPPTEPPTEPFVLDTSLSYWDQILSELEWYGLSGGVKCFNGGDEAEVMKKFNAGNGKKAELDVSGDGVPFSAAYSVTIAKDTANFWDASYTVALLKDLEVEVDDLVVGAIWIRGTRLSETDMFMADDPAEYYLAIKTATDNWATEGDMSPRGAMFASDKWERIFFCGRVLNEESKSSNLQFQIFLGYGNQQVDFGGAIAFLFPSTPENEKAIWKFMD